MRRLVGLVVSAAVIAVAWFPVGSSPIGATDQAPEIDVVSYNVLGPLWASPEWYPEVDDVSLLDAEARRARITEYLRSVRTGAEIVCLQEVTASELPHLQDALGGGFVGMMSVNDPDFWSDWLRPPLLWEPNGTAIFARTDAFDDIVVEDRALGTGNHAVGLAATHIESGAPVRAWSAHLDSDRANNRATELDSVLAAMPPSEDAVDVICGDLNEDAVIGTVGGIVRRAGFASVLASIGNREATHPWSEGYYKSTRWAILDHVLVRGATPLAGDTVDAGVAGIEDESERIEEFLRRMGSDHYPVVATVALG
jgi:endonuclease/exonuclease/phosphatase family metal-dependent hydrolase